VLEICSWALENAPASPTQLHSTQFQKVAAFLNLVLEKVFQHKNIEFSSVSEFLKNISDMLTIFLKITYKKYL